LKNKNFQRTGGLQNNKAGQRAAEKGGPALCAAHRPTLMCSRQPALCSPPAYSFLQPSGLPCCALQTAGPPFSTPSQQPFSITRVRQLAENSCFSIGNTALQPAWPTGSPFSDIRLALG